MALATINPTVSGDPYDPVTLARYADYVAAGVHVPEFLERGVDADFCFDIPTTAAYRSRISAFELDRTGKSVSLQNDAIGRYLQINPGQNGLVGPTMDAREMTYAVLANYRPADPSTAIRALATTATATSAAGGEMLTISTVGHIQLQVRGYSGVIQTTQASLAARDFPVESSDQFLFIAVSARLTGGADETEHTLFIGAPEPIISTGSGVKTLGGRALAFGNAYRADAQFTSMSTRLGRALSGPGPRTVEQLTAMYRRARVIGARRGNNVF